MGQHSDDDRTGSPMKRKKEGDSSKRDRKYRKKSHEDSDGSSGSDHDRHKSHKREHDRDRKSHKRDKEKGRDRRDRDHDRDRDREDRDKERDRDRERDSRRDRDRDRERDKDRERERDRDRDRDRERERERERERDRERERERDRERERERERDRDRGDRDRDRERESDKKDDAAIKAEEEARLEKEKEEERKKEQDKLDEEMRKRRERVEQWRRERQVEPPVAEKEEAVEQEEAPKKEKGWSLEDDAEDDDDKLEEDESKEGEEKGKQPQETQTKSEPEASKSNQPEEEEEDPLEAYMRGVQVQMRKDLGQVETRNGHVTHVQSSKVISRGATASFDTDVSNTKEEDDDDDYDEEEFAEEDSVLNRKKKKVIPAADHATIEYEPFRKDFYVEVQDIARMTDEEVQQYRQNDLQGVKVRGKNCPRPIKAFSQCGLSERILEIMRRNQFDKPTPIQAQAIPAAMSGRDLIGIAKTGSGKTLAYLLPMIRHIVDQRELESGEGMIALIMAPTRELAMQIHSDCKKFTKPLGLRVVCVFGGSGVADQIADLKRGAEIVVCTPGRMIDILSLNNGKITNLKRVTYLVLDEADRMFDMGFEPQIMRIIENIRPERQTVMFSATFPRTVEGAARKILQQPLEIVVGARSVVSDDVDQNIEVRPEDSKFRRLLELLSTWHDKGQIIIFVDRQDECDKLFSQLCQAGYPCLSLHGGMDQMDRASTISDFKEKNRNILVATSIASRGLDVKDLKLVINFDVPSHYEDYVHRVGRTGRAGNKGTAYTFLTPEEDQFASELIRALEMSRQEDKITPQLRALSESYQAKKSAGQLVKIVSSGYVGKGFKFIEGEQSKQQEMRAMEKKAAGIDAEEPEDTEDDDKAVMVLGQNPLLGNIGALLGVGIAPGQVAGVQFVSPAQQALAQVLAPGVAATPTQAQAAQRAAQFALALNTGLPVGGSGASLPSAVINAASAAAGLSSIQGHFEEELVINDYPQQARWKVTHKDALHEITEFTGCAVTTRGTFIPAGKMPGIGERKLYLYIEGPTADAVKSAKNEIKRILEESASSAPERPTGRYTVV